MAKFRFRFASNLRVKQRVEEQKELEYGKALAALELEKQRKEIMVTERENAILSFRESVNKRITPYDLQLKNNYLALLKENIIKQEKVIIKAEEAAELKRQELVEAMTERKILDKLKEKDYEEFVKEERLNEQKIQDEIVSYRYNQ